MAEEQITNTRQETFWPDLDIKARLATEATRLDRSKSWVINEALKLYFAGKEQPAVTVAELKSEWVGEDVHQSSVAHNETPCKGQQ